MYICVSLSHFAVQQKLSIVSQRYFNLKKNCQGIESSPVWGAGDHTQVRWLPLGAAACRHCAEASAHHHNENPQKLEQLLCHRPMLQMRKLRLEQVSNLLRVTHRTAGQRFKSSCISRTHHGPTQMPSVWRDGKQASEGKSGQVGPSKYSARVLTRARSSGRAP